MTDVDRDLISIADQIFLGVFKAITKNRFSLKFKKGYFREKFLSQVSTTKHETAQILNMAHYPMSIDKALLLMEEEFTELKKVQQNLSQTLTSSQERTKTIDSIEDFFVKLSKVVGRYLSILVMGFVVLKFTYNQRSINHLRGLSDRLSSFSRSFYTYLDYLGMKNVAILFDFFKFQYDQKRGMNNDIANVKAECLQNILNAYEDAEKQVQRQKTGKRGFVPQREF